MSVSTHDPMSHDTARDLLSARRDGELADTRALDAHLDGCASCRDYAGALDRLGALAAALPPTELPPVVTDRVARAIRTPQRRRWRSPLLALVPVAAVLAAVLVVALPGPGSLPVFNLPSAAASEPLRSLRTLYVERLITETSDTGFESLRLVERLWYRAPGFVRIEREYTGREEYSQVVIERPGERYDSRGDDEVGRGPRIALPEPLSPTVALLGSDEGSGPVVAGRATRRLRLRVGTHDRVAYVDAALPGDLGSDEPTLVLEKSETEGMARRPGTLSKKTTALRINEPIDDALFAPPRTGVDRGFRQVDVDDLALPPEAAPAGFRLVLSGRDATHEALLYSDDGLNVLVQTGSFPPPAYEPGAFVTDFTTRRDATVAGTPAQLELSLYAPPQVEFERGGRTVRVSAALPPDVLISVAAQMFPMPRE